MFVFSLAAETAGNFLPLILLVGMFVAFYFFGIRPQKKQEREVNAMRNALTVGDEIIHQSSYHLQYLLHMQKYRLF